MSAAERLGPATLPRCRGARVPAYDRAACHASVLHLGVGNFARAHLAVYADDLLAAGHGDLLVRGVSLRSRRAEEQLAPQDGLFTVLERDGDRADLRVVGSLARVETGPAAAVAHLADPSVRLVTLTVTEAGYGVRPGTAELDPGVASVAHDLADWSTPASVPGVLVAGLARRWEAGVDAPAIASLDNVSDNGAVLRAAVLALAGARDPALAGWIAETVRFPRSVVDRMVPATTPGDVDEVHRRTGLRDHAVVVAEPHRSWVMEPVSGLPPLADAGVTLVDDVRPYERRKLWLLNGPHSAVAYAGLAAGCDTIAAAIGQPRVRAFAEAVGAEALAVADLPAPLAPEQFLAETLRRFANPALGHRCAQVAADGSQKLALRVLPVVRERARRGLPSPAAATVIALWLSLLDRVRDQAADPPAALLAGLDGAVRAEVARAERALAARGLLVWP